MIKGLYTAHTGMVNEMNRLDILTNNLANADTTAYKKEGTTSRTFADELAIKIKDTSNYGHSQKLGEISLVTHLGQVYTDYSTGSFEVSLILIASSSAKVRDVVPSFLYAVVSAFARLLVKTSSLFISFTIPVWAVYRPLIIL